MLGAASFIATCLDNPAKLLYCSTKSNSETCYNDCYTLNNCMETCGSLTGLGCDQLHNLHQANNCAEEFVPEQLAYNISYTTNNDQCGDQQDDLYCSKFDSLDCQSDCDALINCKATCRRKYGSSCSVMVFQESNYCQNVTTTPAHPECANETLAFCDVNRKSKCYSDCDTIRNCKGTCHEDYNITCNQMKAIELTNCPCEDNPRYGCWPNDTWSCQNNCDFMSNCPATCARALDISCDDAEEQFVQICEIGCVDEPSAYCGHRWLDWTTCSNDCETIENCAASCESRVGVSCASMLNMKNTKCNLSCKDEPSFDCTNAWYDNCQYDCATIENCPASCAWSTETSCDEMEERYNDQCNLTCSDTNVVDCTYAWDYDCEYNCDYITNCKGTCSQRNYYTTCDTMETRYNDKCVSACPDTAGYDCSSAQFWNSCTSDCDIIDNCKASCGRSFSFNCDDMSNYALWADCPRHSPGYHHSIGLFVNEENPAKEDEEEPEKSQYESVYYPKNKFEYVDDLGEENCAQVVDATECVSSCLIINECSYTCSQVIDVNEFEMERIWVDRCHPDNTIDVPPSYYEPKVDKRAEYELSDTCFNADLEVEYGQHTTLKSDELCQALPNKPWVEMVYNRGSLGLDLTTFNIDASGLPIQRNYDYNTYNNKSDKFIGAYYDEEKVNKEYGDGPYQIENVPFDSLTHLFYGSFPICAPYEYFPQNAICKNGQCLNSNAYSNLISVYNACAYPCSDWDVTLRDPFASLTGNCPMTTGFNNFGKLKKMKQDPFFKTKIIASIGGPELSKPYYHMNNKQHREKFIRSVKGILETFDGIFDGVSLDWQYPGGDAYDSNANVSMEAIETDPYTNQVIRPRPPVNAIREVQTEGSHEDRETLVSLVMEMREMLNELGSCQKTDVACIGVGEDSGNDCQCTKYYELSVAVPPLEHMIMNVDYAQVGKYVDHMLFHAMDYNEGLSTIAHHSNLYDRPDYATSSVERGLNALLNQGVNASQVIMGFSSYGRGWNGIEVSAGNNEAKKFIDSNGNEVWEVDYFDGSYRTGVAWANREHKLDKYGEGGQIQGYADYTTINNMTKEGRCSSYFDECSGASFAVCEKNSEGAANLISYETPQSIIMKGQFGLNKGIGGFFAQYLDGDNGDVINAINEVCGNEVDDEAQPKFTNYVSNGYSRPDYC